MQEVKCIVWDEIVPQHRYAVETLDRTLRDLRDIDKPFGGITLLIGGDFQQTLPIIPKGSREQILNATLTHSPLWNDIHILHLHQNMRLRNDHDAHAFSRWLLDVGHGLNSDENDEIQIPLHMRTPTVESLMTFVYPDLDFSSSPPSDYFLTRMILAPKNSHVNDVNDILLERMAGNTKVYFSADEIISEPGADDHNHSFVTPEFLRSITTSSLPPRELKIKVGCPLTLLRNLSPSKGLCNGSRMTVIAMSE
jgi:hypothetical protein